MVSTDVSISRIGSPPRTGLKATVRTHTTGGQAPPCLRGASDLRAPKRLSVGRRDRRAHCRVTGPGTWPVPGPPQGSARSDSGIPVADHQRQQDSYGELCSRVWILHLPSTSHCGGGEFLL